MATAVVKGPSNEYFQDFEKACAAYLNKIFPDFKDWKFGEKTFVFPPCFPCRYLAPIDKASGAMPLTNGEKNDIRGDDAELKIFHTLDKFGRETGQPMFVFTKLEFKDFTENVLPKGLVEELFTHLSKEDRTREIDFLIIHRHVGIILIEVKATERFKTSRYRDAKTQLEVGEKFIDAFLRMMGLHIPLFKIVAMPNVHVAEHGQKSRLQKSDLHSESRLQKAEYINLRSEDLESSNDAFNLWWKKHFIESPDIVKFSPEDEQGLLKLTAILVGQRAAVCATASILKDVYKIIDKQEFLLRSYKKQVKKESEACTIRKVDNEPDLKVLASQFVFLNPEQLLIWEGPTRQIFCGAPGSGKTILLQHKALECAKKKEFVVIFVPPPLDLLYTEFFKNNGFHADIVINVPYTGLKQFVAEFPKYKKCHVFVDEFQVLLNTNQSLLDSLKRFMAMNDDDRYYQWIVYDNLQLPMANEVFGIKRSNVNIIGNISALCQGGFTHAPSLTTVMRNTSEVYTFLQTFLREYSNVSGRVGSKTPPSAASHDLDTYWKHEIHLGHRVSGPVVIVKPYASREAFFGVIQDQIHEWAKVGDKYYYSKVAVLMAFQSVIDDFKKHLQCQGISVCQIGSTENAVVVDYVEYARSYEWPVVIAVIGNIKSMQNYISYSRAVTRLVTILWKPI